MVRCFRMGFRERAVQASAESSGGQKNGGRNWRQLYLAIVLSSHSSSDAPVSVIRGGVLTHPTAITTSNSELT